MKKMVIYAINKNCHKRQTKDETLAITLKYVCKKTL